MLPRVADPKSRRHAVGCATRVLSYPRTPFPSGVPCSGPFSMPETRRVLPCELLEYGYVAGVAVVAMAPSWMARCSDAWAAVVTPDTSPPNGHGRGHAPSSYLVFQTGGNGGACLLRFLSSLAGQGLKTSVAGTWGKPRTIHRTEPHAGKPECPHGQELKGNQRSLPHAKHGRCSVDRRGAVLRSDRRIAGSQ